MRIKTFLHQVFHWEYWPAFMFYIPNFPLYLFLALKSKSPVFFTAANPAIRNSGDGIESKFQTVQLIPDAFRPKTILVHPNQDFNTILQQLDSLQISFPVIAKPDIGFRGLLVKKITSKKTLKAYLLTYPIDILIQEFIPHKNECGIFYHRIPGNPKGVVSSITLKKFLSVFGDGTSTISKLIHADNRAQNYYHLLAEIHQSKMDHIPDLDEEIVLTVIGNHSKGTQFIDGNHLITPKLTETLDKLSHQIPEWYYGRIDLKYDSFSSLENGENFKIIEINGIISEPTHIYDVSKNSYLDALKSIGAHWKILYKISKTNHLDRDIPYTKTRNFIRDFKNLRRYIQKIKSLSS